MNDKKLETTLTLLAGILLFALSWFILCGGGQC